MLRNLPTATQLENQRGCSLFDAMQRRCEMIRRENADEAAGLAVTFALLLPQFALAATAPKAEPFERRERVCSIPILV